MYTKLNSVVFMLLAGLGGTASANLVKNGDFEQTTLTQSSRIFNTNDVSNWQTTGYNFLFKPNTATSTGARNNPLETMRLAGPGNGVDNGFRDSPSGGNFIGADGGWHTGSIQQTIDNLVIGNTYKLSFDWAAAQEDIANGPTTENWSASLGNQTFTTDTLQNPNHGFQDWRKQIFNFTATNTSEVLSFLAGGTPQGDPPFSLLDNVQLNAVPEPDSLALMLAGLGVLAVTSRRRRNPSPLAA